MRLFFTPCEKNDLECLIYGVQKGKLIKGKHIFLYCPLSSLYIEPATAQPFKWRKWQHGMVECFQNVIILRIFILKTFILCLFSQIWVIWSSVFASILFVQANISSDCHFSGLCNNHRESLICPVNVHHQPCTAIINEEWNENCLLVLDSWTKPLSASATGWWSDSAVYIMWKS